MPAKVFAAALALLTLTACGAEPVPAATFPAERLALPFDRYRPAFAEETEVVRARAKLVQACLHDHGVELDVPPDDRTPGPLDLSPNLRRYGVIDEPTAAEFGYHFPRTPEERKSQAARRRWSAALTEAQRTALFGDRGCTAEADARLTSVDDDFLTDADFRSLRASERDPRVSKAVAAWRACMGERGYGYETPSAAISDRRWNLDAEVIPAGEKQTAVADVRCKVTAHLVEEWHDAEAAVQEEEIQRERPRFDALAAARAARLASTRRVLGSS
jgi:hypothetical protein